MLRNSSLVEGRPFGTSLMLEPSRAEFFNKEASTLMSVGSLEPVLVQSKKIEIELPESDDRGVYEN